MKLRCVSVCDATSIRVEVQIQVIMVNSLETLRDPSIINELMKSNEGRGIVKKMFKLSEQLENLPESDKQKFNDELAGKFADSFNGFANENRKDVIGLEIYLAGLCVVVIFALLGNFNNCKSRCFDIGTFFLSVFFLLKPSKTQTKYTKPTAKRIKHPRSSLDS